MSEQRFLPTPEELILKKGLYEKVDLGEVKASTASEILDLELFNGAIRTYCPDCGQESTFRTDQLRNNAVETKTVQHVMVTEGLNGSSTVIKTKSDFAFRFANIETYKKYAFADKTFTIELYCTHEHDHRIFYTFNIKDKVLQKIGQFPSIADSMKVNLVFTQS